MPELGFEVVGEAAKGWPPAPPGAADRRGDLAGRRSRPATRRGSGRPGALETELPETQLPGMQSLGIQLPRTQLADIGPAGTAFPRARLTDPLLIGGFAEITAMIAAQLDDGASIAVVMPVIKDTPWRWLKRQVRAGLMPPPQAWAGSLQLRLRTRNRLPACSRRLLQGGGTRNESGGRNQLEGNPAAPNRHQAMPEQRMQRTASPGELVAVS